MSVRALGRHSYVGGNGAITTPVTIGHFTSIAPGVQMHGRIQHPCIDDPLLVSTASSLSLTGYPRATAEGDITIGADVWIGMNAVLLGSITIGDGAIIGAYSVVAKDIPPYAVVVGNPVQLVRFRFDDDTIRRLLQIAWWDWSDELITERAEDLRDVRALVEHYGYEAYSEAV